MEQFLAPTASRIGDENRAASRTRQALQERRSRGLAKIGAGGWRTEGWTYPTPWRPPSRSLNRNTWRPTAGAVQSGPAREGPRALGTLSKGCWAATVSLIQVGRISKRVLFALCAPQARSTSLHQWCKGLAKGSAPQIKRLPADSILHELVIADETARAYLITGYGRYVKVRDAEGFAWCAPRD